MQAMSKSLILSVAFLLLIGCDSKPDFDALRDPDRPESWAYGAFLDDALDLAVGREGSAPASFSQCSNVSIYDLPGYHPSEFTRIMMNACDAIREVAPVVRVEHFFDSNSYLELEAFANRIGAIVQRLRAELVCGEERTPVKTGSSFECMKVSDVPMIVPTFEDAVQAVVRYIEDSDTLEFREALDDGEWEQYKPQYSLPGVWDVWLRHPYAASEDQTRVLRFKVLNEPGTFRDYGGVIDSGYPAVIYCGYMYVLAGGLEIPFYARDANKRMAVEVPFASYDEPCRWGSSY